MLAQKNKEQAREILLIATGGTIAAPQKDGKAAPDARYAGDLLEMAGNFFSSRGFVVKVARPFGDAGLDSSDIGPEHWVKIASVIDRENSGQLDGVLITHGTDTMAYTAAWMSLCFANDSFDAPIILTGSQRTPDESPFDGEANLLGAARLIADGVKGVSVYFDWKLFDGRRVHKAHTVDIDAFHSLGAPAVSYYSALQHDSGEKAAPSGLPLNFKKVIALSDSEVAETMSKVSVCYALPGQEPHLSGDEKILIVVGFGVGNIPASYHRAIINTYNKNCKPCIIACSQSEEGERNPFLYRGVGIAELGGSGFTVFKQTYSLEHAVAAASYAALAAEEPQQVLPCFLQKIG